MSCLKSAGAFPVHGRDLGLLLPIRTRLLPMSGEHGERVTCTMRSPPLLAALGWGQHWLHRETLCGNSATVLRHGLGCPCLQLFLGGNKIKSLVRGCWLGAPLSSSCRRPMSREHGAQA